MFNVWKNIERRFISLSILKLHHMQHRVRKEIFVSYTLKAYFFVYDPRPFIFCYSSQVEVRTTIIDHYHHHHWCQLGLMQTTRRNGIVVFMYGNVTTENENAFMQDEKKCCEELEFEFIKLLCREVSSYMPSNFIFARN